MNSKLVIILFTVTCTCAVVFGLPAVDQDLEYEPTISTRDSCLLPMERGLCKARMSRWGYDPNKKECVSFNYGGCYVNGNNFMTREECEKLCEGV